MTATNTNLGNLAVERRRQARDRVVLAISTVKRLQEALKGKKTKQAKEAFDTYEGLGEDLTYVLRYIDETSIPFHPNRR